MSDQPATQFAGPQGYWVGKEVNTMSENTACCAHSKVVLKHNDYPDGTRSDYWECDSGCGKRFFPEHTDMNFRNLRDYFAGQALSSTQGFVPERAARVAYEYADAMLAQREKGKST